MPPKKKNIKLSPSSKPKSKVNVSVNDSGKKKTIKVKLRKDSQEEDNSNSNNNNGKSNSDKCQVLMLLPHQMFDTKYFPIDKKGDVIFYEHPHYFQKYNYNKKKLILHRASMKCYFDALKKKGYSTHYFQFADKNKVNAIIRKLGGNYYLFDPVDKINLDLSKKPIIVETPNFMLTKEDHKLYQKKTDKFFFAGFYNWGKGIVKILEGVKSQDTKNRERMPKNLKAPSLPSNGPASDKKYISEAVSYVNKHFNENYGNTNNFQFPVSHITAKKWLQNFITKKLDKFGPYQDFIVKGENYMFHSCLSTSINIGLINPTEIIDILRNMKSKFPLNSFEGYVRQLFWREYQRYCYMYYKFSGKNYFGGNKKLSKAWYNGTLGIDPVDDAIKDAFETGYLHHILRLMVVGNYMNLIGIAPQEGKRWFIEFACDSYEWVMEQNVLDMVFCVSGGDTMRKPYASSSNYLLKMSHYKKGEWSEKWDTAYLNFVKKNKAKLHKFRYHFPILRTLK